MQQHKVRNLKRKNLHLLKKAAKVKILRMLIWKSLWLSIRLLID